MKGLMRPMRATAYQLQTAMRAVNSRNDGRYGRRARRASGRAV